MNQSPTILSLLTDHETVFPGDTAWAWVEAFDPDGDDLAFDWSVDAGRLLTATDADSVSWEAPGGPDSARLSVVVSDGRRSVSGELLMVILEPQPLLQVIPARLDFGDTAATRQLLIRNAGGGDLDWSATGGLPHLTVNPPAGTAGAAGVAVTVALDRTPLAVGAYRDTLTVHSNGGTAAVPVSAVVAGTPVYSFALVDSFPHDRAAFTQGLAVRAGVLFEGTGRHGQSSLRAIELASGAVLRRRELDYRFFGEGITLCGERVIQLTLNGGVGFVYAEEDFGLLETFGYPTQGWGITYDGQRIILSDGSTRLFFLDPQTYTYLDTVEVRDRGVPVDDLNELEYVRGEIFANVWHSDRIARIAPENGAVLGWVDLAGLREFADYGGHIDVLNGIAYDSAADRLFVTGKLWPVVFEIRVVDAAPASAALSTAGAATRAQTR